MEIDLSSLARAIARLEEAHQAYRADPANTIVRDSVVIRFLFTYELGLTTLRKYLDAYSVHWKTNAVHSTPEMIRTANRDGLLKGEWEQWHIFRDRRNQISHTYNEDQAIAGRLRRAPVHRRDALPPPAPGVATEMSMPAVHMTSHQWDQVEAILRTHLPGHEVFAFGSRATGKRLEQYSDLDLAIPGRVDSMIYANLVDAFDESLLPFKVDILELDRIDPSFRARIELDFILLTTATSSLVAR